MDKLFCSNIEDKEIYFKQKANACEVVENVVDTKNECAVKVKK